MITVKVTPEEMASARMNPEHLQLALNALRDDGFVVLEDVVDVSHLMTLRERMMDDLQQILSRPDAPFQFNTGNVQQDPPPFPPYLFRDVLLNDMVIEVTRAMLGPGVKNSFYSGNTALPGGERQPVHPDLAQLWPNLQHPTPPYGLVVNIPVVDMDAGNGSTELWPGTHHDTSSSIHDSSLRISPALLEERRAVRAPLQPTVRCGSVIIRDMRLWHAGMPNHTQQARPMIAMIHWCSWWTNEQPVVFPKGTEEFFQHPHLKTNAQFIEGALDYTWRHEAFDFQKS